MRTLGQKLAQLRMLEGHARGLGREMTQTEVSRAIREEMDGKVSQPYLSQLESGARPHLTGPTRLLLARFFKVHPGHLVDDVVDIPTPTTMRQRRDIDDRLDIWLIEAAEEFEEDPQLAEALLKIAKHPKSRDCLLLLASVVENKLLIEHLIGTLGADTQRPRKRRIA
jgi:transcriptional regulator with XRE-family HTH domain